jgi:hypothetical protein
LHLSYGLGPLTSHDAALFGFHARGIIPKFTSIKFYRLKARRGYKPAAVAVAHVILVTMFHILSHRVCYNELGDRYLDKLNKHHLSGVALRITNEELANAANVTPFHR